MHYPLWFVCVKISWKRFLLSDKVARAWFCVDGARGAACRVDGLPENVPRTLAEDTLYPLGVDREAALRGAISSARSWARAKLFCWWPPFLEVEETALVYKPYVIEGERGEFVKDLLTGERLKLDRRG